MLASLVEFYSQDMDFLSFLMIFDSKQVLQKFHIAFLHLLSSRTLPYTQTLFWYILEFPL